MEQSSIGPNQEIVVRFNGAAISANEARETVTAITDQLRSIGVTDVQVSHLANGEVKVTYFSTVDVNIIKNLLHAGTNNFSDTAFNKKDSSNRFPFQDNSGKYQLEVIQIQQFPVADIGFQGVVVEVKSISDQYLQPKLSPIRSENVLKEGFEFELPIAVILTNTFVSKKSPSYKIPQVRAGPTFC